MRCYLRRHRKHWTSLDISLLRKLAGENTPIEVLSATLGRSRKAIRAVALAEGISLKPTNQRPYGKRTKKCPGKTCPGTCSQCLHEAYATTHPLAIVSCGREGISFKPTNQRPSGIGKNADEVLKHWNARLNGPLAMFHEPRDVIGALRRLVDKYVANRGHPDSEFILNTGLHANELSREERDAHPWWKLWDDARRCLGEDIKYPKKRKP